jgi:purine-binding chemotaxis protein CheW
MSREIIDEDDYESIEDEKELETKYLIFGVGEKDFGLKIKFITEIVSIMPITEIPNVPVFIKGIINLRGKGIPVIDARIRFGSEEEEYNEKTVIVILNLHDHYYGLIVDCVREVISIQEDSIEPSIDFQTQSNLKFVEGLAKVGDRVKILLDVYKLIGRSIS